MKKHNLVDCLDHIFWWLMWLLPLVGGIIVLAAGGSHDFASFYGFLGNFSFPFVADLVGDIMELTAIALPDVLITIISYLVSVEICHVFVDVLVFIPRLCHKFVQLDTYTDYIKGGRR